MLYNMFSMFDPNSKLKPMNLILIFLILKINYKYWNNKKFINYMNMMKLMNNNNSSKILLSNMMKIILIINLMNIIPMMFSNSHNINFTLNLTIMMWLMSMMMILFNNYNILLMNISPKETSMKMILIINIIELNSLIFMIMSISLRLMINMMMGHLIMNMMNFKLMNFMYLNIEMIIILIQSYIYFTLNYINMNNFN